MTVIPFPVDRASPPPAPTNGKRPKVNATNAIRCSAALDMMAAAIRQLDEYAPTSGLPNLKPWRDAFWKHLPTIEALAVLVEDEAVKAMNEGERA